MNNNQIILEKMVSLIVNDFQINEQCRKLHSYEELIKSGVPYGIYLQVYSSGESKWDGNSCYIELKKTSNIKDLYLKLCLKEIIDFARFKKGELSQYKRGVFSNILRKKDSISEKAAKEAKLFIEEIMGKREYAELTTYAEGIIPNSYSIKTVCYKVDVPIYKIADLGYKELTYNNNGNQTEACIVLGIPFEMNIG